MDQSLWSDIEVVKLSRKFVCARLATYEDAKEGKFLESVFRGRSGQLENTVFVLMAPDGKTKLSPSGRSPRMVFGGSEGWESTVLALEMFEVSEKYPGKEKSNGRPNLPINKDLRRAINVASCDRQLLVIAHQLPKETIEILSKIAWGDQHIGQFAWEITSDENEFPGAGMGNPKPGIFIGNPDEFGLKLNWLKTLSPNAKEEAILSALAEVSKTKRASEKSSRQHVSRGKRLSKSWESEIPNTDPQTPPPNRRN